MYAVIALKKTVKQCKISAYNVKKTLAKKKARAYNEERKTRG